MREQYSTRPEITEIQAVERIGREALVIVDHLYGSGHPDWSQGETPLSYHNGHHGRSVGNDGMRVASHYGLDPLALAITGAAGHAHDLIQLKGRGVDESESAQWLDLKLIERGITDPSKRAMGTLGIRGTLPRIEDGKVVGQLATEQEYPTREAEISAKSVACGDFGEIYTPRGPLNAHELFREINGMCSDEAMPFEKMTAFQRGQVWLLENYQYPLAAAESILATHRSEVTTYVHDILDQLEQGIITSWPELIQRDKAFLRRHS